MQMNRMGSVYGQFVVGIIFLLAGCTSQPGEYRYAVPPQADDGWEVASLQAEGMDPAPLEQMMDVMTGTEGHNIHAILIFRNGKLLFEEYFEGYLYSSDPPGSNGDFIRYDSETDHYLASVSKSITSVVFGAAVKEGLIEGVDQKVVDMLSGYEEILTGEKAEITLEHMLNMASGLPWDETSASYGDPANDVTALFLSADPIEHILSGEMVASPGETFLYNSGTTNVLGAVVQKAAGMSLLDFGNQMLLDPLNIQGGVWQRIAGGYYFASGGIFLRPRELAKIGFLFLNDGYWGDHQVITREWIDASTQEHIATGGKILSWAHAYGYQWWHTDFHVSGEVYPCFHAAGWGDQYMFIFPDLDLITVINGGNYSSSGSFSIPFLMEEFILASVQ